MAEFKTVDGAKTVLLPYNLSPTIAVSTSLLAVSYIARFSSQSPYVFSTMTNMCYVGVGFWRELYSSTDAAKSAASLVGQFGGGAMVLILLGGASFAFHRESVLNTPAHSFDIVFGWILVLHVFYVAFSVAVLAFVKRTIGARAMKVTRGMLSVQFLIAVCLLMIYYDGFYGEQMIYFLTVGGLAVLSGVICRSLLAFSNGKFKATAVRLVLLEVLVTLTMVVAAIIAQGELLGRKLKRATDQEAYDFYHGQWHFLLAAVAGMVYSRTADTARLVKGENTYVCVCSLPKLDLAGLLMLLVYSIVVIVAKETEVDLESVKIALTTFTALFLTYAAITLVYSMSGDGPRITSAPSKQEPDDEPASQEKAQTPLLAIT